MTSPVISQDELFRYSRHMTIPEVGLEGQKRLKSTSVLIVGVGGLGSPAALYLAAAGIGHLGLVDDDEVEVSNLQRQIVHGTSQVGNPKVDSGKMRLSDLNPLIQIDTFLSAFNQKTAAEIAAQYDIIVDCSDNFATRYLVNDLCVLTGRPDIYGAVNRFEGQVSVFDGRWGPCYRCLFPQPPSEEGAPTCRDSGVLGVVPGVIGTLQATEVIKLALGIGDPLIGKLLVFDALEAEFKSIRLTKRPYCSLCGVNPQITQLIEMEDCCLKNNDLLVDPLDRITAKELDKHLKDSDPPLVIDVRDPVEKQISVIEGARSIPLEHLIEFINDLNGFQDHEIVVFCRTGNRSKTALRILKSHGFKKVKELTGGINAWAQLDPDRFQY
ncbi:MAG: molybdopterin-synthase adenylyltransferase MoeB [Chloroflexi bacterium]|nr:molybdopterin-synthase adenylyltransferase MoeB [Chloroflexota bacterium]